METRTLKPRRRHVESKDMEISVVKQEKIVESGVKKHSSPVLLNDDDGYDGNLQTLTPRKKGRIQEDTKAKLAKNSEEKPIFVKEECGSECGSGSIENVILEPPSKEEISDDGCVRAEQLVDDEDPDFWAAVIAQDEAREASGTCQLLSRCEPPTQSLPPNLLKVRASDLDRKVWVNRGPVLTLWAAVVAFREGYDWEESLTFGRAVAGHCAQSKGQRLGVMSHKSGWKVKESQEYFRVFGMEVLGERTTNGARAVQDGIVLFPANVEEYLRKALNFNVEFCTAAFYVLAEKIPPSSIGGVAYRLYEQFRPQVPCGVQGWGAKGALDLNLVCSMR